MQPITNESITVVVVRGVVEEGPLPFFVVAVFVFAVGAGFGFFLAFCAIFARSCSAFGREGEKDNGPLDLRTIGQINQSLPIINYSPSIVTVSGDPCTTETLVIDYGQ